MSGNFYKEYLYPLQDKALQVIDSAKTAFYLTGGTASSRCYLQHRYSDDLDFFQNQSKSFLADVEHVLQKLSDNFILRYGTRDLSFCRVFIKEDSGGAELKIEFINDVAFRVGDFMVHPIFSRVDSWMNILCNKVTALSRYAPKDVADILFLCFRYQFNWKEVISAAKMKDAWVNEIIASQIIYEFDSVLLNHIHWVDESFKSKLFSEELKIIARELLHGLNNSLSDRNK